MSLLGALVSVKFARFVALYRKYDPAQPRDTIGRWIDVGAGSGLASSTLVIGRATTGNTKIDDTTDFLTEKLTDVLDRTGGERGFLYGIRVHSEFARVVREAGRPGIEVEKSFQWEEMVPYGVSGSIRTDIILRDQFGSVLAIWDIKTGGATLSPSRARELRRHVGVGSDVPIIQLHELLGNTIKARMAGLM